MNLSPHFTLEELSHSDIAVRLGIDNTPDFAVTERLERTAQGMEYVRMLLNSNAIRVSSGYRCPALNEAVHGSSQSQHMLGQAVDFTCQSYGPPERIVRLIADSAIGFDQLILEFDQWVHISFTDSPRHQVLVIDKQGTRQYP